MIVTSRWAVLALCFVTLFGPYYCFDNPASNLNAVEHSNLLFRAYFAGSVVQLAQPAVLVFPPNPAEATVSCPYRHN
jgi:hypothetical protein